jgi:hypothetical protein
LSRLDLVYSQYKQYKRKPHSSEQAWCSSVMGDVGYKMLRCFGRNPLDSGQGHEGFRMPICNDDILDTGFCAKGRGSAGHTEVAVSPRDLALTTRMR